MKFLKSHPRLTFAVLFLLIAPFLSVNSVTGENAGVSVIGSLGDMLDNFPASKLFFLALTVVIIIFAVPAWKKLNK